MHIAWSNRLLTAGLAACVAGALSACLPFVLLLLLRGHGVAIFNIYLTFRIWAPVEFALAFVLGFALGADRAMVVFGHLCATARPRKIIVTAALWSGLIAIPLLTNWLSS